MLKKDGRDQINRQHWTLFVPDEHCNPGLEVGIVATKEGIEVGGELIDWEELASAKESVQAMPD